MEYTTEITGLAAQYGRWDVLIVDGNFNDLHYLSECIEAEGFRVYGYKSNSEAIYSILRGLTVDLAVVDQGSFAFEARVVLRLLEPLVPCVVLTRHKCRSCYLEAMHLGAIDYLEKPLSPAQIKRVLSNI